LSHTSSQFLHLGFFTLDFLHHLAFFFFYVMADVFRQHLKLGMEHLRLQSAFLEFIDQ